MLRLILEDGDGQTKALSCARTPITLGRDEDNTVRLLERNVSRHHARLVCDVAGSGAVAVEDLRSANGVRVNGARVAGRRELRAGDRLQVGDFDFRLADGPEADALPVAERVVLEARAGRTPTAPPATAANDTDPPAQAVPAPASRRRPWGALAAAVGVGLLAAGAAVVWRPGAAPVPAPRAAVPAPVAPVPVAEAPAPPLTPEALQHAREALRAGLAKLQEKDLAGAEARLRDCLALAADLAPCHLALGTVFAHQGEMEQGAEHYRRFLQLAPGHARAQDVRQRLDAYEQAKARAR